MFKADHQSAATEADGPVASAIGTAQQQSCGIPMLPIFEQIPDGAKLLPIVDTRSDPALKPGQWAVIDPNVTELEINALYVIREIMGDHVWQVLEPSRTWRTVRGQPAVILAPVNRKHTTDPFYMGGPCLVSFALKNMVGRVTGKYRPCGSGSLCGRGWDRNHGDRSRAASDGRSSLSGWSGPLRVQRHF